MSREPALLTSAGRMPKRSQHRVSEGRMPKRTSGDGAWAAPNRDTVARRGESQGTLETCPHGEPDRGGGNDREVLQLPPSGVSLTVARSRNQSLT